MATYVKEFGGYIADVPRMWFKRCDGRLFYFDELTAATITPQVNYTEVNAGWSLYPVAYLPGQSTFEMQVTSGKFEADLFVMANATKFKDLTGGSDQYEMSCTEVLKADTNHIVTLAHVPLANTISITYPDDVDGMMNDAGSSDPTAGTYQIIAPQSASGKYTLKFYADDVAVGQEVTVSYFYNLVSEITGEGESIAESKIDNRSSAIGEAICVWPVYGSGDECSDSSIIGNVIVKVYRARVTAAPGFDSSYKTANTFQFTLGAMDAKRADNASYSITYVRKDNGIL